MPEEKKEYRTVDKFDSALGALMDIPTVTKTKPSTVVSTTPLIGGAQTYIVQTLRQAEVGDFIFVQYIDDTGSKRLVLPPGAADAIARQRDALGTKNRRRAAKETAQARKARGELPGFMKKKGK